MVRAPCRGGLCCLRALLVSARAHSVAAVGPAGPLGFENRWLLARLARPSRRHVALNPRSPPLSGRAAGAATLLVGGWASVHDTRISSARVASRSCILTGAWHSGLQPPGKLVGGGLIRRALCVSAVLAMIPSQSCILTGAWLVRSGIRTGAGLAAGIRGSAFGLCCDRPNLVAFLFVLFVV